MLFLLIFQAITRYSSLLPSILWTKHPNRGVIWTESWRTKSRLWSGVQRRVPQFNPNTIGWVFFPLLVWLPLCSFPNVQGHGMSTSVIVTLWNDVTALAGIHLLWHRTSKGENSARMLQEGPEAVNWKLRIVCHCAGKSEFACAGTEGS